MIRHFAAALALIATLAAPVLVTPANAADYPTRPVTLIVAFTPGGPSDVLARIIGRQLEKILGQTFVIDNRPGGAGNIAAETVAHATPDGYTLLMGNNGLLATNQSLFKKLNFDGERDFAPISLIGSQPNILVVNPKFPAKTMAELIAYAKANPGKLNYANSGFGAAAHLSAELFKSEAKVDIVSVSYKGAAPALQDVIADHIQLMFVSAGSAMPQVKAGAVKMIGVGAEKRMALLPDVPAIAETVPGFTAVSWFALFGPAGMPPAVAAKIAGEVRKIFADPTVQKNFLDAQYFQSIAGSPDDLRARIAAEEPRWRKLITDAHIKVE